MHMQYHGIQKPLKSQTPMKRMENCFFSRIVELLEISYFQDCATYTNITSKCREHPGWDIYGILTGDNPLLCFTFRSSEMFHQLQPSTLELSNMLRRPKKYTGAHYARTPKNNQTNMSFGRVLRVFRAKIRVFYRLAKAELCPKCVEGNDLFELHYRILWVFYGLVRDFCGSQKLHLSGHHEHDETCNDWSLGLFPGSWHQIHPYTVMLWTSWMGLFIDEDI